MSEFIIWIVCILGYGFMAGITYRLASISMDGDSGFDNPAVFFSGALWPVALPAGLGSYVTGRADRPSKDKRRRDNELLEAQHRKELARLDAEALAIHEKSLNIT